MSNQIISSLKFFKKFYKFSCKKNYSTVEKLIDIKDGNGVRKIIMNSPKTRNAMSIPMMEELLSGISNVSDPNIRCIIISSNGPVFSSGHNLKDLDFRGRNNFAYWALNRVSYADAVQSLKPNMENSKKANGKPNLYLDTFSICADLMLSIIEAPVPVIASVNGIAAAAGCQLVATCDIVIATDCSSFSTPGANFGIFCSTPGIALSRSVGRKAAARMLLTGMSVTAEEALQIGLVSKICKKSDLENEVEVHVNAIKTKSRAVIELGKKFFYQHLEKDIRLAYQLGAKVMTDNLLLVDGQEGLQSFVEKRHPSWKNDFSRSEKFNN